MFYDDLLLLFCDAMFIFVINFRAKSLSLATYDENGDFVTDDIPFCDDSERRHKQIVTDCNISSSVQWLSWVKCLNVLNTCLKWVR
jgi:hypothetical protein